MLRRLPAQTRMSRWSCRSLNRKIAGSTWLEHGVEARDRVAGVARARLGPLRLGAELDHPLGARPDVELLVPLLGDLGEPLLEPLLLPAHHVDDRVAGADQHLQLVGRSLRRSAAVCGGAAVGVRLPARLAGSSGGLLSIRSRQVRSSFAAPRPGMSDFGPGRAVAIRSSGVDPLRPIVGIVASNSTSGPVIPKAKTRPSGWMVISLSADSSIVSGRCASVSFDEPQTGRGRQFARRSPWPASSGRASSAWRSACQRGRYPSRTLNLTPGMFDRQPGDDRTEAAVEMAGQEQVSHDQVALPRGRGEVAGHDAPGNLRRPRSAGRMRRRRT